MKLPLVSLLALASLSFGNAAANETPIPLMTTTGACSSIINGSTDVDQKCITLQMANGSNCDLEVSGKGEDATLTRWRCSAKPDAPISVKFLWLGADQVPFLLGGMPGVDTPGLIGKHPIVARNDVYKVVDDIYHKFGSPLSSDLLAAMTEDQTSVVIKTRSNQTKNVRLAARAQLPASILRTLRFPNFDNALPWPSFDEQTNILRKRVWPSSLSYSYESDPRLMSDAEFLGDFRAAAKAGDPRDTGDLIAQCMTFSRFVSRTEFDAYWDVIDALGAKIDAKTLMLFEPWESDEGASVLHDAIDNASYDFLEHVTEENWPDDFLIASGSLVAGIDGENTCDGAQIPGGISFNAQPRSLKLMVAVIEPVNGTVDVESYSAQVETLTALRKPHSGAPTIATSYPSSTTLSSQSGDALVVPLHISLDYDDAGDDIDAGIAKLVARYPSARFAIDTCEGDPIKCTKTMQGTLRDLPPGESRTATPSYLYGPSLELASITVDGKSVAVRENPGLPLFTAFGGEPAGSCPFLFWQLADGSQVAAGRVLVGATNAISPKTDKAVPPAGAVGFYVRELEPEVTKIQDVAVFTGSTKKTLAKGTVLRPRQQAYFALPAETTSIEISGYYVSLLGSPPVMQ